MCSWGLHTTNSVTVTLGELTIRKGARSQFPLLDDLSPLPVTILLDRLLYTSHQCLVTCGNCSHSPTLLPSQSFVVVLFQTPCVLYRPCSSAMPYTVPPCTPFNGFKPGLKKFTALMKIQQHSLTAQHT